MNTIKHIALSCMLVPVCFQHVNAQVNYIDVNPDVSVSCSSSPCNSTYSLDLNNDGTVDFSIKVAFSTITCFPNGSGMKKQVYIYSQSGNASVSLMMNVGDTIGSNLLFTGSTTTLRSVTQSFSCGTASGPWINSSDHYAGLRISSGGVIYYGWIRLNVYVPGTPNPHFIVKDYAFNSTHDQIILAGQTCDLQSKIKANGPVSFCAGNSVDLSSKNSGNTLKYQWKKNNTNIAGAINKNYLVTTAGNYKVKITDTLNGCYKLSNVITIAVPCRESDNSLTGVKADRIIISPNPIKETAAITFSLEAPQHIKCLIFDINGRFIKSVSDIDLEAGDHQLVLKTDDMPAGFYFLQLSTLEFTAIKKLVISK